MRKETYEYHDIKMIITITQDIIMPVNYLLH